MGRLYKSGKRGNKRSNGEKIQTLGMHMSPQMGRPGTFFFVAIHGFVICGKLISAMGARLHHRVHLMLTIIWERPECTRRALEHVILFCTCVSNCINGSNATECRNTLKQIWWEGKPIQERRDGRLDSVNGWRDITDQPGDSLHDKLCENIAEGPWKTDIKTNVETHLKNQCENPCENQCENLVKTW